MYTNHGDEGDEDQVAAAKVILLPEAGDHHDHGQAEEEEEEEEEGDMIVYGGGTETIMMMMIKRQIASHPLYPSLVSAHIDCQKVGAPPEVVSLLEEILEIISSSSFCSDDHQYKMMMMIDEHMIGGAPDHRDPELDHFMESYCGLLHRYKEELSKPFQEATTFLTTIESQLTNLCKLTPSSSSSSSSTTQTSAAASSSRAVANDHEVLQVDQAASSHYYYNEDQSSLSSSRRELKEMLQRKYSGYLTNLRKEFLNKRKPGKLPKDARATLLEWWTHHHRWPYPTEEEKARLAETTGLDQKQINNWFINQRKLHWRPSEEDSKFALIQHTTTHHHHTGRGEGNGP